MLDVAKLRLYPQIPKRAPLLFHSEAKRDVSDGDDDPKDKKRKWSWDSLQGFRVRQYLDMECVNHNMTAVRVVW
jgi:hypothetical protein